MLTLEELIKCEDWKTLSEKFSTKRLVEKLKFANALLLSKRILENEEWNDNLQTFAISLIETIKETFPVEWESDWRHEAYLGYAYDLRGWEYEKQFDAYKNALEKSDKPDPEVLMRLSINWSCPGIYKLKIDENQAIQYLEEALKVTPYVEGVSCLIDLYSSLGEKEKINYWKNILENSSRKKLHAPYAFLAFFDDLEK